MSAVATVLAKLASSRIAPRAVPGRRKKIALAIAAAADLVQLGMFPIFGEGALSIPDDALDLGVALVLLFTIGFSWRLALALLIELVPAATLFPTWTLLVMSLPTQPTEDSETATTTPTTNA